MARTNEAFYLCHDLTSPLPLPDACVGRVYSEHFIEHVSLAEAIAWLREVHRVLRPGGILRVTTPDLRKYVRGYMDRTDPFFEQHRVQLASRAYTDIPTRPAWMMNQIFYFWGHKWIYDLDELRAVAASAGFRSSAVFQRAFRDGTPELAVHDQEDRQDETLYVEISKG